LLLLPIRGRYRQIKKITFPHDLGHLRPSALPHGAPAHPPKASSTKNIANRKFAKSAAQVVGVTPGNKSAPDE
jgi:hypothetical protein